MENTKSSTADRELYIEKTLNAPIDLVWEAFTRPEHIANWYGPEGFTTTIFKMEVKPGGEWNFIMHGPDGTDYDNKNRFKELVPLKKIVYEHVSYPPIEFTITFEDRGEQTHLRWHMVFASVEVFKDVIKNNGADEGLKQNIEKLARYMSKLSNTKK